MHRRSVDFPDPESPIKTTNSPRWMSSETPSRARVPLGYVFTKFLMDTIGGICAV
jgi:hypothetical protein